MSAGMARLGTLASPIIGVLAAWLRLEEYSTPVEATGMSLIGLALAMLAWSPQARDPNSTA
jgi:drug/metabolite transporter (DMT)-like permease